MNKIVLYTVAFFVFIVAPPAHAEDLELAKLFKERNLSGTMVISSLDGETTYIHNDKRARTRFVPASTFKIPNTLIALEEAAVSDEKEIVIWDGKDKGLPEWNKDQTLQTAFSSSCVWFYQEMAKRVGKDKYASYLGKMKYGNEKIGPQTASFWLEGDLMISAMGQVAFLKNIFTRAYPFKSSSYDLLRKHMLVEQTPAYTIRAKTGWAQRVIPQVGWFVGYVESGGKVWFYATNIEIVKPDDSRFRQEVTMEALKMKGII
ncbi:MAG: beta-lactamase [Desulfobulbaceae bacterium BRH_c16a]|nr:MAG: beta-lactamase [Desulfobulbaceae bacterium BRH_c16a]